MTLLKASRMPLLAGLLCVLLLGFAGASYGAVRFDVVPSPTEVVNTGRSEVTGSVNLIVRGTGNVTGTQQLGHTQIGLIYTNPAMQIDNTTSTGIILVWSAGFGSATPTIKLVENFDLNGRCTGRITIDLAPSATPAEGDYIRLEGVRGRIDASLAVTPGTDLYVDLQSINDPAANSFTPDRVRVAKSLDGMNVKISPSSLLLCFPTTGRPVSGTAIPDYYIKITEGFARAFVDADSNAEGVDATDRVDSNGNHLGDPTNSTEFLVWFESIPASVSAIAWDEVVPADNSNAWLALEDSDFDATTQTAWALYSFQAANQTDESDVITEVFTLQPVIVLKAANQTDTGTIMAGVTLAPDVSSITGCRVPGYHPSGEGADRPRFLRMFESDDVATNNPPDDPLKPYASIIRCNCYMLFTYVTATSAFNTGIAVANTTGDTAVFGDAEAPNQVGPITFYFYDRSAGYVGSKSVAEVQSGRSYIDLLSNLLPSGVTEFSGYVIAKADFQFCHGFAFIADSSFAAIAHGYVANIIPDPAIKGIDGIRTASDAGDFFNVPAGEGLNN
jgi:hypothetical protein